MQYETFDLSAEGGVDYAMTSPADDVSVHGGTLLYNLDIPIYDPRRLAALQARKALKRSAAADYRATALQILEEVDTAQINLRSHRAQTAKVRQELKEVQRARDVVREQWKAGLTSRVSDLEAQRRWLSVSRTALNLQQATLNSYLNLIKAVGGGTLD